jgi:type IV pilus assembly protein PilC
LLNRNLMVVSIQEKIAKKGQTSGGKVPLSDLVMFTRQLATMVDAGLAMVQSLQALAEQTDNKVTRDVIKDITTRVEGGDSFSDALQKHPKVFNKLYYSMVSAGEKGGLLAEILARLATYLENTARLRKKVKSAMMYPTAVTIIAIGITIFLLVKVVPVFGDIFSQLGGHLPTPTAYLIKFSNLLQHYFILFHPGGRGDCGRLALLHQNPRGPRLLGRETDQAADFWFDRPQDLPGAFCPDDGFAGAQRRAHPGGAGHCPEHGRQRGHGGGHQNRGHGHRARRGHFSGLEQASGLSDHDHPHDDGRRTNRQNRLHAGTGGRFPGRRNREHVLSGLTSLIEPLLIVFLGVVVGGIVICMFLPIFKLSDLVSGNKT